MLIVHLCMGSAIMPFPFIRPNIRFEARVAAVSCLVAATIVCAQNPAVTPTADSSKSLAYEVVSIRPNKSGMQNSSWRMASDGIVLTNAPLSWLVRSAFAIRIDDQLTGLPGWVNSENYDIQAKMDEETAAAWKNLPGKERTQRQQLLLQQLLADRCGLKFHRETKQATVYDLVIANGGLKMKEAAPGSGGSVMSGGGQFEAKAAPVESLAYTLSGVVDRLVIDRTGLGDKRFDFQLKWTPDEQSGSADAGPSIFAALEEQLGLKLVSSKGPVETVVVDHMERPTPN